VKVWAEARGAAAARAAAANLRNEGIIFQAASNQVCEEKTDQVPKSRGEE
jgi:hypothetical protein